MIKQIFLDTETTGVSQSQHEIWQIAALVYIGGKKVDSYELKINPVGEWNSYARDMCKVDLSEEVSPAEGFHNFVDFLKSHVNPFDRKDKYHFYAYNSPFDEGFVRSFFKRHDNNYYGSFFWTPSICIMKMAGEYLREQRKHMPNFRQGTVARILGIDVDEEKLHDALYDAELAKQIYDIVNINK